MNLDFQKITQPITDSSQRHILNAYKASIQLPHHITLDLYIIPFDEKEQSCSFQSDLHINKVFSLNIILNPNNFFFTIGNFEKTKSFATTHAINLLKNLETYIFPLLPSERIN